MIDGHGSMLLAGARSVGHIIILITEGQVLKEGLLQAVAQNLKKIQVELKVIPSLSLTALMATTILFGSSKLLLKTSKDFH